MNRETKLNVIYKLTASNGWRREWDMEFRDGAPRWVTLSQWSPENVLSMQPAPLRISADQFFEEFAKEWGGFGMQEQPQ